MRVRNTFIRFCVLSDRLMLMRAGVYLKRLKSKLLRRFVRYVLHMKTLFLTTAKLYNVHAAEYIYLYKICTRSAIAFPFTLFSFSVRSSQVSEIVFFLHNEAENME